VYYQVSCELTIRLLDVGDVTRISNLAGQISKALYTYRGSTLMDKGISKLQWNIVSTTGYAADDNEYNEKQVLLTFNARVDECLVQG
jgi:CTP:phosphocholine cytidylyltransferase-like protein